MASDKPRSRSGKAADRTPDLDSLGLEMGNKPPQAVDVEESVLGAMMLEPNCVDQAMGELTAESFYDPKHRLVFEAMGDLVGTHTPVDIVTVTAKLREKGNLEIVGGASVLASFTEKVGSAAHLEFYINTISTR